MTDAPHIRFTALDYVRRMFNGVRLTNAEADILVTLYTHRESPSVTLNQLSEVLWPDPDKMPENWGPVIEKHISRMRKKIMPAKIIKHRLHGYRLEG